MNAFESFRFLDPEWLWLLPLALWLPWQFQRYHRRNSPWTRLCDARLLARMTTDRGEVGSSRWLMLVLALLLVLAILSAAGPSWRKESYPLMESGAARVLVLDLSRRMLVEDLEPNRFEQSLALIRTLLAEDYDGETGMVVYAGAAFVVAPLSHDVSTLLSFLDALHPETMPLDGARVDLGIDSAQQLLEASVSGRGHIVVIGSGSDDVDTAVDVARRAAARGHRVSVLAVGTEEGGPLRDKGGNLLRDAQGRFVVARTRFDQLRRIAAVADGSFVRLAEYSEGPTALRLSETSGNSAVAQLRQDEDRAAANDGALVIWLMLPLALLLFRRNALWVLLVAVCLPVDNSAQAQDSDRFWQHAEHRAMAAYRDENYAEALEHSENPLLLGAAYYRLGRYTEALEQFTHVDNAHGWYNRANAHARLKQFPEALSAYQQTLERYPDHSAAAANLALVEAYLDQQRNSTGDSDDGQENSDGQETGENTPIEESRIGLAGQALNNPGDQDQSGPGIGASTLGGQFSPDDSFDGRERELERFALPEEYTHLTDQARIDRWIRSLPESSSELFRRKFLRDYERQQQQAR